MANERRLNKSAARPPRHGSSTTTATTATAAAATAGSSNSSGSSSNSTIGAISGGKKQSRQYRLPRPPVPHAQTSLLQSQRVPASAVAYPSARQVGYESPQLSDSRYYASGGRGGLNTTTTTTTTTTAAAAGGLAATSSAAAADATDGPTEAAVPSADPDAMEAKKGLNKWGAFDSFSGSGTGSFGFGPLLFHHVDETPRDPYDTTNMMLNDPISFNPMSAISWARLDESPESIDELDADHSSAAHQSDMARAAAAGARGGSRREGSSSRAGYVDSPASTAASPRHGSGASYASDVSESRTSSVAGSSVGNISRTFSDTNLVSPDTERSTAGAPPAFSSPSSSRTPNSLPSQQQQLQQLGRQTDAPVQYGSHEPQRQAYPTQQQPSSRSSSSHRATTSHQPYSTQSYGHTRPPQHTQQPSRHRHQQQQSNQSRPQQQQQQQQQVPAPTTTAPVHQAPETTDLLLCLGPHCSARFPTEQELAAHYRAEHAFTCTWTPCSAASFTSSNALAWHVNAEHLFVCPMPGCCGAPFGSKRALDGHLKGEVVTSSGSTPSGTSSSATPRKHSQQQPPQQHHHRARRRSKSPSFSPGHRPPQRTRR